MCHAQVRRSKQLLQAVEVNHDDLITTGRHFDVRNEIWQKAPAQESIKTAAVRSRCIDLDSASSCPQNGMMHLIQVHRAGRKIDKINGFTTKGVEPV
ncbi:hypothetical protein QA635_32765 [Bradyrhizobium brasilense]|uniref:hypothetical protein n=1 Tax=Bradyrhizobium brasilense TaxID=1419277 RepID=UPI0024B16098|nr:hypothetical protein [Bradyrhizobium australafricanum]WFU31296.1 hypothetical protein QA635_32765 [Bradyrhizobium australafricanum]